MTKIVEAPVPAMQKSGADRTIDRKNDFLPQLTAFPGGSGARRPSIPHSPQDQTVLIRMTRHVSRIGLVGRIRTILRACESLPKGLYFKAYQVSFPFSHPEYGAS